jgi:DNA-directed RNA polymerase specialized sigma24 family protein
MAGHRSADDAVQDAWERVSRAGADDVENLGGWLTTIVARVCLNMLRSRQTHHEQPLEAYVPDPIVSNEAGAHPEEEALLADSVGLALQVVIDALSPPERERGCRAAPMPSATPNVWGALRPASLAPCPRVLGTLTKHCERLVAE